MQQKMEFETPHNGTVKAQLCNLQLLNIIKDLDAVKQHNLNIEDDKKKIDDIQRELDQIRIRNIK